MSVKEQQTGAWAPEWVQETEPDYTPRPRRSRKQRRPRWPGIALALVCLATIAALVWHFTRQKEIPLETAAGYVASEAETAPLYDEEGNVLRQLVRGSQVTMWWRRPTRIVRTRFGCPRRTAASPGWTGRT